MSRTFVLVEYDGLHDVAAAYQLQGETVKRLPGAHAERTTTETLGWPDSWDGSYPLLPEGIQYVLHEGIRSALEILAQADEGQERVEAEIDKVVALPSDPTDPEACDDDACATFDAAVLRGRTDLT